MNKTELIDAMATNAGISKVVARKALDGFIKSVSQALRKGDKVALSGFGAFSVAERASRTGVNPSTKEIMTIEAKNVVKFKAGAELSDRINRK
jgi:DNA-binding protein HU-beta